MYLLKLLGFLLLQFCIVFLCLLCQYPVTVADIRSRSIYIQLCHLSPTLPLENSPLYLLYYTKQIKKKKSNHPFYLENYTAIDFDPACPIYFQVLTYLLYRVVYLIDRGFQSAGSPCQGEPAALFLQLSSTAFGCSHWGVPHWCCWMFAGKRVWFRLKSINWGGGVRNFLDGQERSEEGNSSLGSKLQSLENCWRKYVWGQIFFGNRAVTGKL